MGAFGGSGSLGTLWIEIAAKVDGALQSLDQFGKETGRIVEEQKSKWDSLANVGAQMSGLGTKLTAALTLPIAGIGAAAVSAASDFESSLNKIAAVSGTTGAEMDQLRAQAMKLGADTKFSAQEAAEGMGNLAAAGLNTTQIMAAMPGVLDLAAAGAMSVERAAEVTSDTLGQFGLKASEATRVADVMAQGAAASAISVDQMAFSLKYAGPIAQSAGISLEGTATAIALLGNAGIKGEQAGTSLRSIISSLISPSNQAAEAIEKLGIKTTDASGKMLPLDQIFAQLQAKGATTADMFTIFGDNAASAAAILQNQAGPAWAAMTTEIDKSDGAAKRMADTLNTGMKGAWEQMKGSLDTVLIALGQSLLPILTNLVTAGTQFINEWILPAVTAFGKLDPTLQTAIIGFAALLAGIGPLLIIAGQFAQAIVGISTALPIASAALTKFTTFVGVSMAQIALYTGGILIAVAAIYKMYSAVQDLDKAEADLAKARDTANKSLERTENYLRSQGAAVDALKEKLKAGQITQREYEQGLQKMALAIGKGKKAAEETKKPLTDLEQLQAKLAVATGKVTEATEKQGKAAKETADKFKPLAERHEVLHAMAAQLEARYRKLAAEVAAAKLAAADMTRQTELLLPPTQALTDLVGKSNTEFNNLAKAPIPEAIRALGEAKEAVADTTETVDGLEGALKNLGSTSQTEYQKVAAVEPMKKAWETLSNQVSTIINDAGKSIAKGFMGLFDDSENRKLKEQSAELSGELQERTGEYQRHVADVSAELAQIPVAYQAALSELEGELAGTLAGIDQANAKKLSDMQGDYERYVKDVISDFEKLQEKNREQLDDQLADLQDNLGDRKRSYNRSVDDANRSYRRDRENLQDRLNDSTRDYRQYVEDQQLKLKELEGKEGESAARRRAEIQLSLQHRFEDYVDAQNDIKQAMAREEEDLRISLARKAEDFEREKAEVKARQDELTAQYKSKLDEQNAALQQKLAERKQTYETEKADTVAAYETQKNEVVGKFEEQKTKIGSTFEGTTTKLNEELAKAKTAYDTYRTDIETKLGELETAHKGPLERIGGMFKGVFDTATDSLLRFLGEGAMGALFKQLGNLLDNVLPSVSKALGGIFSAAGGAAQAAGGAGGQAGDVAGKVPGVPGGGAGGGAAGRMGGIGGLAGTVSAISGVATAISGVIGNFQMAGMNKSLDIIVLHTLQTANDLYNLRRDEWDRFEGSAYSTMGRMGELLNELRIIQPDVSLARMSIQAIEGSIGAGQAVLEGILNLGRDTASEQRGFFERALDIFEHMAVNMERQIGFAEKSVKMNLYGTDPDTVSAKIAAQLRLQGVPA
jgi:TP901 family phage tail tape measure protein